MGHHATGLTRSARYLEAVIIERSADGGFEVEILSWQRQMMEGLVPQLRELLLAGDSPAIRRLFPTAYPSDPKANANYDELVHDQLLESQLAALDTVESNLEETNLSEPELYQWMQAINSLRLVVGTRLDVSEDDDPDQLLDEDNPDRQLWLIYQLLTEMLSIIVDALAS